MELIILKKKLDGFRATNGMIRDVSPEVLWELRQVWETFTGPIEQFRSELGMKVGTLRKLLTESKKLNHTLASAGALGLSSPESEKIQETRSSAGATSNHLELVYDQGNKVIRFPDVDSLIDFL